MENNETLSESFKRELEQSTASAILNPAYRRKKFVFWVIRTTIAVVLYVIFWKYNWVKWSLLLTIPLSIFSLLTIVGTPYLLNRKIERTKKKIEMAEKQMNDTPNE